MGNTGGFKFFRELPKQYSSKFLGIFPIDFQFMSLIPKIDLDSFPEKHLIIQFDTSPIHDLTERVFLKDTSNRSTLLNHSVVMVVDKAKKQIVYFDSFGLAPYNQSKN